MAQENETIADLIRSGAYFKESRAWYQAVYIGPVSERTFFLIIAIMAMVVFAISVMGLRALLPLVDRPKIVIAAGDRPDEVERYLVPLRESRADVNTAIARFFVLTYVGSREGYSAQSYQPNAAFVQAHSNAASFASFSANYSVSNPQSPAAKLGVHGKRVIQMESASIDFKGDSGSATVGFSAQASNGVEHEKSQWTAKLDFTYTGLELASDEAQKNKAGIVIKDPQFQVVNYVVTQTK